MSLSANAKKKSEVWYVDDGQSTYWTKDDLKEIWEDVRIEALAGALDQMQAKVIGAHMSEDLESLELVIELAECPEKWWFEEMEEKYGE